MTTEEQLQGWTGPSSTTEQEKQDRTERMVRDAIANHDAFRNCSLSVYAKGSYANNTNVQADSDVDIAVQCHEVVYWDNAPGATHSGGSAYTGSWTPTKLRAEIVAALKAKFPGQVDTTGSTAVAVHSSSARVDADVVPCFDYHYYFTSGGYREGTRVFPKTGSGFENYPAQHLAKGRSKNNATNNSFKRAVRILKRVENLMVSNGYHREVPSYFVECLVYNCPTPILNRSTWMSTIKGALIHIWEELQGDAEPADDGARWLEVNEAKYLFSSSQKWSRKDGRDFAKAGWNYLGVRVVTERPRVQVVAAVVIAVFAIGILASGGKVDAAWLRFYSVAVTAALIVLGIWNRLLWRIRWAQKFKAVPRDLRGTWKGVLKSQWVDPSTGQGIAPKPAYLVVRQTSATVSVILLTDESVSRSSLATVRGTDGSAGLDYMYLNEPKSSVEHRSRMHHGSTSLSITGRPATRLHGRYWTDRDSRGELDFAERRSPLVDDYESAVQLFSAK